MASIRWKVKDIVMSLYRNRNIRRFITVLITTVLIGATLCYLITCGKFFLLDITGIKRPKFLYVSFTGGLANQMFQYAFGLSMAKKRQLEFIIPRDTKLIDAFGIKPNLFEDHGYSSLSWICMSKIEASLDCGYDRAIEESPYNKDLRFHGYFQSWKYWQDYENEVRTAFTFKTFLVHEADRQLSQILKSKQASVSNGTILVGVHVRSGDYLEPYFAEFGYRLAPASYLKRAADFFRKRFKKVIFIVCTNGYEWTEKVIKDWDDFYLVKGNSAELDMALLSRTNHTIMTVGTYGWMISWLTGGITVHYKYPYREGSRFSKHFHPEYYDHFMPNWIAME